MKYGKLINGAVRFAPNPVLIGGNYIGNPPAEVYAGLGDKPVVFTDPPEVGEGYLAVPGWEETAETIVQTWTAAPEESDDEGDGFIDGDFASDQDDRAEEDAG